MFCALSSSSQWAADGFPVTGQNVLNPERQATGGRGEGWGILITLKGLKAFFSFFVPFLLLFFNTLTVTPTPEQEIRASQGESGMLA